MYLVDTNVVCAGAPRRTQESALNAWIDAHSAELYLSVVTVAEVEDGIAKAHRGAARRKAAELRAWLEAVLHLYGSRILPLDIAIARATGTLSDLARSKGMSPGFADLIIAATAKTHELTVLTRNTRHFTPLEIPTADPFTRLPP